MLDLQPLNCIGVIGAPDLGREVQHTRIEASSSTGAGLKEQLRIAAHKALHELIDRKDVPMPELSLTAGWELLRGRLGDLAVHVPLDIGDIG